MNKPKHPKSLWVLSFGKIWDSFSYIGTQTILALYFIHIFHLSQYTSYLLYGAYAAFAFSAPILGGVVADKWIGSKSAIIFGCMLNIAGNLMLVSFNRYLFCLGLATSIIGSGLYKSNSTHLVGTLYNDMDFKKEVGFTWFYSAINLGGTLGPLAYGLVVYYIGWNYGFLCSAIGIAIGAIWLLLHWGRFNTQEIKPRLISNKVTIITFIGILFVCGLLSLPFYIPMLISPTIAVIFTLSIVYLIFSIRNYQEHHKRRLFGLLLISFLGMFYFSIGLQIGTTITLFIQHKINEGILKMQLPASTFSVLYSFFVLVLAPFTTQLWKHLKLRGVEVVMPSKLAMGMGLTTFSILAFAFASLTNYVLTGVIIGNLLLSAGAVVLTPAAYTAMSNLSPVGMKSTMMGCWLLFVALGGYFSGVLANIAHFTALNIPLYHRAYLSEFLFLGLFTLIITIVVIILIPKLSKMLS